MEGQRPGDMPAQGNALGKTANIAPALKGRHRRSSAPSGLYRDGTVFPGRLLARPPSPTGPLHRLAGLACLRTGGAPARSTPRFQRRVQRKRRGGVSGSQGGGSFYRRGEREERRGMRKKSSPLRPFQKPLRLCGKIRPAQRERERGRDAAVSTARRGC